VVAVVQQLGVTTRLTGEHPSELTGRLVHNDEHHDVASWLGWVST
jgi:hypothetical protein